MTEWQGTPARDDRDRRTPLLTLVGRRGQIMHVDPFANASGNYSVTIVGKPGSGKSVVMNQLAFSCLAQGGLVWIIDVGRSYEKTCAVLDGAFLVFDKDHVWDLNPFAILEALAGDDRSEGIESVVSILGELVSPDGRSLTLSGAFLIQLTASAAQAAAVEGRIATLADLDADARAARPRGPKARRPAVAARALPEGAALALVRRVGPPPSTSRTA